VVEALPSLVMVPFKVAVVTWILVAAWVVTVGLEIVRLFGLDLANSIDSNRGRD